MASQSQDGLALQLPMPACWPLYFPDDAYAETDRRAMLINQLLPWLASPAGWALLRLTRRLRDGYVTFVDYTALRDGSRSADLVAAVDIQPAEGLACIAAALHEALFVRRKQQAAALFGGEPEPGLVRARLTHYPQPPTAIHNLRASAIGKLVTVTGTVVRASAVRPLVTSLDFLCGKCGGLTHARLPEGVFAPPQHCASEGCRGKSFQPDRRSARGVDWQKLRIQELNGGGGDDSLGGQIPRTVEVELREDLCGSCMPGDTVTLLGLCKVISTDAAKPGRSRKAGCLFLLYLEAVSLTTAKRPAAALPEPAAADSRRLGEGPEAAADGFSQLDLQFVAKFCQEFEGEQFRHLVHALAPDILGHELVKAGLLLALFGGVRRQGSSDGIASRADIHVLLCGDPGLGKSRLLQAVAAAAPRGIYVCGNGSSAAGLTAAVSRDPVSGSFQCEAGALVLADGGVCCLDEFDKMSSEHAALLGAMEQQEVTTAKGGVCARLPARAAIVAAANPAGGHYSRARTLGENLRLPPALLSRFDLAFLLLDAPDEALDARLSEHVLALHAGEEARARAAKRRLLELRSVPAALPSGSGGSSSQVVPGWQPGLAERLRVYTESDADPVPPALLRKYVAYARRFCHPTLTPEAKEALKAFYLELRGKAAAVEGGCVTARQLEALVRLCEARARTELREAATAADAADVIELMRGTLLDELASGLQQVSAAAGGGGRGGKQAEARRLLAALAARARLQGSSEFAAADIFSVADSIELRVPDLSQLIAELNDAGELLKRGGGRFLLSKQP